MAAPRIPEIIAHRGASHDAPENTLAAARLAWAQGADALECDVHLTRDERLAVVHDEDLFRVAGQRIRVSDATCSELKRHDVGRWKAAAFCDECVPELVEILATVPAGKRAFVELKGGPALVPALARCLAETGFAPSRLVVISFDLAAATEAKRVLAGAEACWVVEPPPAPAVVPADQLLRAARDAGLDGLDVQHDWLVSGDFVQRAHAEGLKVYVWTVDHAADALRVTAAAVDGITTNRPGWLRGQLAAALRD